MTRPRLTRARSGFTMLEATISLALLMLAILGMGSLAAATYRQNMDADDMTQAANLAGRIAAQLKTEAVSWSRMPWDPTKEVVAVNIQMPLLRRLPPNADAPWAELTKELPGGLTRAYTKELALVAPNDANAMYCVHYALTWLQKNETIRADIRVYWRRRGSGDPMNLTGNCGAGSEAALSKNLSDVRSFSQPVFLHRNAKGT